MSNSQRKRVRKHHSPNGNPRAHGKPPRKHASVETAPVAPQVALGISNRDRSFCGLGLYLIAGVCFFACLSSGGVTAFSVLFALAGVALFVAGSVLLIISAKDAYNKRYNKRNAVDASGLNEHSKAKMVEMRKAVDITLKGMGSAPHSPTLFAGTKAESSKNPVKSAVKPPARPEWATNVVKKL